ncbi:hypothetical protein [uncultured Marinobacter sp.]|uniref:hypothetical protein n=1 Tax=uncultured Marinobacter sp. TaxID=187379 RepID=UPI002609C07B|nr:hypothetical protein [uncultured Marinobacter sp.]
MNVSKSSPGQPSFLNAFRNNVFNGPENGARWPTETNISFQEINPNPLMLHLLLAEQGIEHGKPCLVCPLEDQQKQV